MRSCLRRIEDEEVIKTEYLSEYYGYSSSRGFQVLIVSYCEWE